MTIREFYDLWDNLDRINAQIQIFFEDEEEPRFEGPAERIPESFMDDIICSFQVTGAMFIVFNI